MHAAAPHYACHAGEGKKVLMTAVEVGRRGHRQGRRWESRKGSSLMPVMLSPDQREWRPEAEMEDTSVHAYLLVCTEAPASSTSGTVCEARQGRTGRKGSCAPPAAGARRRMGVADAPCLRGKSRREGGLRREIPSRTNNDEGSNGDGDGDGDSDSDNGGGGGDEADEADKADEAPESPKFIDWREAVRGNDQANVCTASPPASSCACSEGKDAWKQRLSPKAPRRGSTGEAAGHRYCPGTRGPDVSAHLHGASSMSRTG
ncbi:hypothetical protein CDD83_8208 [Cordyceps sp. RAO-2017]|nr:hypothetical protein CDD83_8208 [Cordyceps sp. RAO-2017]